MRKIFCLLICFSGFVLGQDFTPAKTVFFNNNKYELYTIPMLWTEAYQYAESKGGYLVTILSIQEQEVVYNLSKEYLSNKGCGVWLGLVRSIDGETFEWVTGEPLLFTNWGAGQPDNGYNCQMYGWIGWYRNGLWDDLQPTAKKAFIVKYYCN